MLRRTETTSSLLYPIGNRPKINMALFGFAAGGLELSMFDRDFEARLYFAVANGCAVLAGLFGGGLLVRPSRRQVMAAPVGPSAIQMTLSVARLKASA